MDLPLNFQDWPLEDKQQYFAFRKAEAEAHARMAEAHARIADIEARIAEAEARIAATEAKTAEPC